LFRVAARSFDTGGPTYHHVYLLRLSFEEAKSEIMKGKNTLEDMLARELLSFSYPWGGFNNQVIGIVKEAGFMEAKASRSLTGRTRNP
jgi:peptidoglycan/xylan/chitin deacetylase (PgdA/CDA1 family)